jgi:hypothetical protein
MSQSMVEARTDRSSWVVQPRLALTAVLGRWSVLSRGIPVPRILCILLISSPALAQTTLTLDETVIAPKTIASPAMNRTECASWYRWAADPTQNWPLTWRYVSPPKWRSRL